MTRRHALLAALCLAPALVLAQVAVPADSRLKRIQDSKTIKLAYRTDALPFSFEHPDKKPGGYTVELCAAIVNVLERQLGLNPLFVNWVPVNSQNRFTAIASGQADLECGASTVTLGRMKEVSFSSLTFIDGTGLLVRNTTPGTGLRDLAGKKIGVVAGTTNEAAVAAALKELAVSATVVPVKTRDDGLAQLDAGAIDAFAGDRVLLMGLAARSGRQGNYSLLTDALSYEPYAIALPRGDWALQQAVNAAIAQFYMGSGLPALYNRWFSDLGRPSPVLEVMYGIGRLPE